MSWVRVLVAVVIALPVGALAGRYFAMNQSGPGLSALAKERDSLKTSAKSLQEQADKAKQEADSLARENRQLQDKLASAAKTDQPADAALEPVGQPKDTTLDSGAEPPADASAGGQGRGGRNPNETEEERQARIAQYRADREQRSADMRDRMRSFMDEQIQNAPDKASQDRLSTISANGEQMMELFQQMRDAQTDDERNAIRDQIRATGEATRPLVQEQQDSMMRQTLAQNGVSDPKAQDAAIQSLRQTMESPFFRGPFAFGGGGGPGGGPDGGGGFFFGGRGRGPGGSPGGNSNSGGSGNGR